MDCRRSIDIAIDRPALRDAILSSAASRRAAVAITCGVLATDRSRCRWTRSSRRRPGSRRSSAGARSDQRASIVSRSSLPSSVELRVAERDVSRADLPAVRVALDGAAAAHRLVAQRASQIREREPRSWRCLSSPLPSACARTLDATGKLLVSAATGLTSSARVVRLPGARLRELQLTRCRSAVPRALSTSYSAIVTLFLREHAARRALCAAGRSGRRPALSIVKS